VDTTYLGRVEEFRVQNSIHDITVAMALEGRYMIVVKIETTSAMRKE
jgi:hypothetical protein